MAGINMSERYDKATDNPYFRRVMPDVVMRFSELANSDEFRLALEGKTADQIKETIAERNRVRQTGSDQLFIAPEHMEMNKDGDYVLSFDKKTMEESDRLSEIVDGLRDSYGAAPPVWYTKKLQNEKKEDELQDLLYNMRLKGFIKGYELKDFLTGRRSEHSIPFIEALKTAADAKGYTKESLYDDLTFINDAYGFSIPFSTWQPDYNVKKTRIMDVPSWGNYSKAHLQDVPHTRKEKEEYLAKAMVGALFEEKGNASPAFSKKTARRYAEAIKRNPIFKKICENPLRARNLLDGT